MFNERTRHAFRKKMGKVYDAKIQAHNSGKTLEQLYNLVLTGAFDAVDGNNNQTELLSTPQFKEAYSYGYNFVIKTGRNLRIDITSNTGTELVKTLVSLKQSKSNAKS